MTQKTSMSYGDPQSMMKQAAGLFAMHMQRNSTLNRLAGKMPQGTAGAEATLRKQTTQHMPIVRCQDLSRGQGDEIRFNLVNPVSALPIMGDNVAEGKGVGMSLSEASLRVNQARFPVDGGGTMTNQRSPADYRALMRPNAQALMDRYADQTLLVHMAGARGFHDNIEWGVPLEAHPKFQEYVVNPVKAPSKNRHFVAAGDGVTSVTENGSELKISSTDLFTMDTVDSMRTVLDQIPLPPPIVKFEGDKAANDSPLRVWLLSPAQYNRFAADPKFRQLQASAIARASQAGQNPLFLGEAGLWNGFILVKMPRPIRFYAGDEMKYCADKYSETESGLKIPASFGEKFAVDRSVILGGQAVLEAFANTGKHGGMPFFWSEKELDHGNRVETLIGTIRGVAKTRFAVDVGEGQKEITDYGVTVVDTVIPLQGGIR
jgi:putative phage structural protein|nr:MAG TPA: major capsid protein [Caudoviricetes sp.]